MVPIIPHVSPIRSSDSEYDRLRGRTNAPRPVRYLACEVVGIQQSTTTHCSIAKIIPGGWRSNGRRAYLQDVTSHGSSASNLNYQHEVGILQATLPLLTKLGAVRVTSLGADMGNGAQPPNGLAISGHRHSFNVRSTKYLASTYTKYDTPIPSSSYPQSIYPPLTLEYSGES